MAKRSTVPMDVRLAVLTEAGYRCAVPTCRTILAIDIHHLNQVKDGGGNTVSNLIALCPTCHALFHRGEFKRESLFVWKATLVSLSQAFDKDAIDDLLFVALPITKDLLVSGDGILKFSRLISAGFVQFRLNKTDMSVQFYTLSLTEKGEQFISAWQSGNRTLVGESMKTPTSPALTGDFIQTWAKVELRLRVLSGDAAKFVPPSKLLLSLLEKCVINAELVERLTKLSRIRNEIVHRPDAAIQLTQEIVQELKVVLESLEKAK